MGCGKADADKVQTPGGPPSAVASVPAADAAGGPLRVVFVGTSLTAGLGLDPDSAYPAAIQRRADAAGLRVQVVNAGVSGETSAGALRRIDWVLREPADVIVLETGANDGLRALRVDSTRANVEALVRKVKAVLPAARIVLVQMEAPPNLGAGYTGEFHAMFPSIAQSEGITLAPFLLEGVAGVDALNQADGVHPNAAGERKVTDNVWRALEPVLRATATAPRAAGPG
jgi:acyl-CoA thioesterase-1